MFDFVPMYFRFSPQFIFTNIRDVANTKDTNFIEFN